MKLQRFNSEEELSSIRFSCADEAIGEVKNLFFKDQLAEEQILLELYSPNLDEFTAVNLKRLNIDRVFSKRQIVNKYFFRKSKLVDSVKYQEDYSIRTILEVKSEQRRLGIEFKGYYSLLKGGAFRSSKAEPLLFAKVGENIFYLLNDHLLEENRRQGLKFKNLFNWIKKGIFTKTFFKSLN